MKSLRWMLVLCMVALVGAFALPAAAQEQTFGLSDDDYALFSAAQSGVSEQMAYIYTSTLSVVQGSDTAISWDLSGSGLFGPDGFSMVNEGTLTTGSDEMPAPLWLTVVGDSLFLSIDGEQWFGGTVEELTTQVSGMAGSMMGGMPGADATDPNAMANQLMAQPGVMEAMMGLGTIDPETFIRIRRNEDFNGQASFTTEILLSELASSEALAPLLGTAMASAGGMGSGAEMTAEQTAQMGAMVGAMLQNSIILIDQFVNIETQQVESAQITIELDIQGAATIELQLGVELSSADGQVPEAPATFTPFAEAMSSMGSMMGG